MNIRILWAINLVPVEAAKKVGIGKGSEISWVKAMMERIVSIHGTVFAVVSPGGKNVNKLLTTEIDNVKYYILPKDGNNREVWKAIIDDFNPDIVHSYGTEQKQSIPLVQYYRNTVPIIVSLQGIITTYKKYYYAGLSKLEIIKNYTLYDIIKGGILKGRYRFEKQSKVEQSILNRVYYVEGRSDWDRVHSMSINPDLQYHYCPRMIRAPFYGYYWTEEKVIKHSIFVHQGSYPIKGLHYLLDALYILKKEYNDIKLYISGNDIFTRSHIKTNGYVKLIKGKINKYKLKDCISFTGLLSADQLGEMLSQMNVCVIPSAIENAPNALAEAMIVGTPCVASFVGGNAEMLYDGNCGLLYRYDDPDMLADCIKKYFNSPKLSKEKSECACMHARKDHDPELLVNTMMGIYNDVIQDFKKKKENEN